MFQCNKTILEVSSDRCVKNSILNLMFEEVLLTKYKQACKLDTVYSIVFLVITLEKAAI